VHVCEGLPSAGILAVAQFAWLSRRVAGSRGTEANDRAEIKKTLSSSAMRSLGSRCWGRGISRRVPDLTGSTRLPGIDTRIGIATGDVVVGSRRHLLGSRIASPLSHATRRASCSSNASLSSASPPYLPSGMASGRWWRSRHRGAAASGLPKKPLVPRTLHRMADIGPESTHLGYSACALGMALSAPQQPSRRRSG
jgi:hypothetical protein